MSAIRKKMAITLTSLAVATGCGSVGPSERVGPDGGSESEEPSGSDAGSGEEEEEEIAVGPCGLLFDGMPGGETMVFHRADGTQLANVLTDASGLGVFDECEPDTMVSVMLNEPPGSVVLTVAGVDPGVIVSRRNLPIIPDDPDSTAVVTTAEDVSGVDGDIDNIWVSLGTACDRLTEAGATEGIAIHPYCVGDDPTDVDTFAYARAADATVLAYSALTDHEIDYGGGTILGTMPGWVNAGPEQLVTFANPPAPEPSVEHVAWYLRDGVSHYVTLSPSPEFVGGNASVSLFDAPSFFDRIVHRAELRYPSQSGFASYTRWYKGVGPDDAVSFDLHDSPTRLISAAITFPEGRSRMSWFAEDDFTPGSSAGASLAWNDGLDRWLVVFPVGEEPTFDLPTFEGDFAPYNLNGTAEVRRLDVYQFAGLDHDDVLAQPLSYNLSVSNPVLEIDVSPGVSGQARHSFVRED